MGINFEPKQWEKVKANYELWWDNKLERPLIPVIISGRDPVRKQPIIPYLSQSTCNDLSISAKDIVDRISYSLESEVYLGDSFPYVNLDSFGPGVIASFLGASLDNSTGRVWFHPNHVLPITELHFEYDSNNLWLNRIREICCEAMKLWQGQVLVGMPDLGGILDIISTFRPADNLLLDLYDYPEEVERLVWELHELWHKFYNEINDVLQPINPGYSDWSSIYSAKPVYVIQSDVSYMISPDMFDIFVKPELKATCSRLPRSMYHLDGVGQLAHLNSLLEIEELDVVQWVPGTGKPPQTEWPDVYKKIKNIGKKIQIYDGRKDIDQIVEQLGTGKGIHCHLGWEDCSDVNKIKSHLRKYGIE